MSHEDEYWKQLHELMEKDREEDDSPDSQPGENLKDPIIPFIALSLIAAILILVAIVFTVDHYTNEAEKEELYIRGISLIEIDKYFEGIEILESLGDYKDSKEVIKNARNNAERILNQTDKGR